MDNDFQVSGPVVALHDGCVCCRLQLRGVAGLQPLRVCHYLDLLHPFFADTSHLAAEVLHFLVIYGAELVQTWSCGGRNMIISDISQHRVQKERHRKLVEFSSACKRTTGISRTEREQMPTKSSSDRGRAPPCCQVGTLSLCSPQQHGLQLMTTTLTFKTMAHSCDLQHCRPQTLISIIQEEKIMDPSRGDASMDLKTLGLVRQRQKDHICPECQEPAWVAFQYFQCLL